MFAELGALSNFTFLEGASHPKELVAQAHALGHAAIGILRAKRNATRWIKRHPRWLALARRVQVTFQRKPEPVAGGEGDQVP